MKKYGCIVLLFFLFILLNCLPNVINKSEELSVNGFIYYTMKDQYLWYDKIPNVDYEDYSDPEDLLEALMYTEYDKWSYVATVVESDDYEEGQYPGYGFLAKWFYIDTDSPVLGIAFVYDSSPADTNGLSRGDVILSYNGVSIPSSPDEDIMIEISAEIYEIFNDSDSITFNVRHQDDTTEDISLTKGTVTIDPILYTNRYTIGNKNIKYIVFNEFITPAVEDLKSAFENFDSYYDEMILDLRYNTGGLVTVANYLANLLAGKNHDGKVFFTMKMNDRYLVNEQDYMFQNDENSIDINRIFIITTSLTASASELIINGLKPYMDVKLIGTTTHGKPVGMLTKYYVKESILLVPITFRGYNAAGVGDYFDGINPDSMVEDDLAYDFGDEDEPCLKEALYYIENNMFQVKSKANNNFRSFNFEFKGIKQEIGAF